MWFRDLGGTLWQADLPETQSGHLMIPVQGQLYDLSQMRSRAEQKFGVTLPPDAQSLVDLMSTPGALEELQKSQGPVQKYMASASECASRELSSLFNASAVEHVHLCRGHLVD